MRLIAAALFSIAIAIVILAGVILAVGRESCTLGGSDGLPAITVDCSSIPR